MFTSLISLTITATRRFSRLLSTWLSNVVFPAPRKPDRTVTGSLFRMTPFLDDRVGSIVVMVIEIEGQRGEIAELVSFL